MDVPEKVRSKMVWTLFWDMHSGGNAKEKATHIYIRAPEEEAKRIFQKHYGHDPENVTCECCGSDYSIQEDESLQQATAYHRGCAWNKKTELYEERPEKPKRYDCEYQTLKKYCSRQDVKILRLKGMKNDET